MTMSTYSGEGADKHSRAVPGTGAATYLAVMRLQNLRIAVTSPHFVYTVGAYACQIAALKDPMCYSGCR